MNPSSPPVPGVNPRRSSTHGITLVSLSPGVWTTTDKKYVIEKLSEIERCDSRHPNCPGGVAHERERWAVIMLRDGGGTSLLMSGMSTFKEAARWLARRVRG